VRLAAPASGAGVWPANLEAADHQVVAIDLGRLLIDLEQLEAPSDNPMAAMVQSMLSVALARIGKLRDVGLDVFAQSDVWTLSVHLGLQ
jgi:hypothetical protein